MTGGQVFQFWRRPLTDNEHLVKMAYRSVLRRDPEPDGLRQYTERLNSGELNPGTLLEDLLSSQEYLLLYQRGGHLGLTAAARRFLSPNIQALSTRLQTELPLEPERFSEACRFGIEQTALLEFYNQEEYLAVHRKRFFELDNIVANLVRDVPRARVLDVGISINSIILSKLLPSAEIAICDRFELKGQPFDFFDVDLTDPDLDRKTLHQEFDVIIFTEVLAHLLANPVRVFNFFLRHLRPDGHLIVTTPNFFSAANSRALALGENPQPIFSARLKRGQEVEHHVREYSMSELLLFAEEAGGAPAAFFFSSCWDSPSEDTPPENRGNLCAVFKCDV